MLSSKQFFESLDFKSPFFWKAIVLFGAWFLLFFEPIMSAARIWYISEIFQHGFFIIPGAFYFIWRERDKLIGLQPQANYWVLLLLLPFFLLAGLGYAGGIQVFLHIATFTILPLMMWMLLGNRIAKIIWFPLCFILFSIPIGEELVPHLQKITADLAIAMLNLTSIPSYNTGLYIEIPEGKFVVAEACSGIRFFIGSIVFGAVYSHISYQSFGRKLVFMALSIIVPVLANALRVFTIVLIGHYVDMEYASGADHLIYGWVFFAIVLFLLILLGETFREKQTANDGVLQASEASPQADSELTKTWQPWRLSATSFSVGFLMLLGFGIWQFSLIPGGELNQSQLDRSKLAEFSVERAQAGSWSPILEGASDYYQSRFNGLSSSRTALQVAWYPENREGHELIASGNAFYDKEFWSVVRTSSLSLKTNTQPFPASLIEITSSGGEKRWVLYWYQLESRALASAIRTKLLQALDVMFTGDGAGAVVILSSAFIDANKDEVKERLVELANQHAAQIHSAMPF